MYELERDMPYTELGEWSEWFRWREEERKKKAPGGGAAMPRRMRRALR